MLPKFYQTHLKSQLTATEYLFLSILITILQSLKKVNLETLATALPIPITFESRRKKLQRFLLSPNFTITKLWLPLIATSLKMYIKEGKTIYIALDRTTWDCINILMVAMIWHQRVIPVYFELLPKLGNSNLEEKSHFQ